MSPLLLHFVNTAAVVDFSREIFPASCFRFEPAIWVVLKFLPPRKLIQAKLLSPPKGKKTEPKKKKRSSSVKNTSTCVSGWSC
ncbi:uncharacterized protein TrAtP1_013346 [Trichoderma atroviride]|uniref:uncharacterized protein n=1 Tax=Hypocrea atroviridis TaxID=63577 RepID=UPI003326F879|nr:hypothetical protein TrAtP1_013346 [Trichoderma atroviride]